MAALAGNSQTEILSVKKKCYCGNHKLEEEICYDADWVCMNCCDNIPQKGKRYACKAKECQFKAFNGFNFILCSECYSSNPSMDKSSQFIFYALSTIS